METTISFKGKLTQSPMQVLLQHTLSHKECTFSTDGSISQLNVSNLSKAKHLLSSGVFMYKENVEPTLGVEIEHHQFGVHPSEASLVSANLMRYNTTQRGQADRKTRGANLRSQRHSISEP